MARSTYLSANLNQKQIRFLQFLDDLELDIFSLEELKKLAGVKFENVSEFVENLVHKNILSRIERGKYCRVNFREEGVIGCRLVDDGVLGYWSALNKHGLTEQFPQSIFIQTTRQKQSKVIFGVRYKFIRIDPVKRAGILIAGYGNHSYLITDIEKTFIDCFDLPQYSGGFDELLRAFSKVTLDGKKLINYASVIGNFAAVKRMGFLAELLEKQGLKGFISEAKHGVNPRYTVFDPRSEDQGEFVNTWRLRLNMSRDRILQICNNPF
jgi:predicted transcriptional regulator of viral defense system